MHCSLGLLPEVDRRPRGGARVAAALLLASVVACATPYEPTEDYVEPPATGSKPIRDDLDECCGYSEVQNSPTIFRVSFYGNSITSHEMAEDFALLRSAEVTLEQGHRYFVILNKAGDDEGLLIGLLPSQDADFGEVFGENYAHVSRQGILDANKLGPLELP